MTYTPCGIYIHAQAVHAVPHVPIHPPLFRDTRQSSPSRSGQASKWTRSPSPLTLPPHNQPTNVTGCMLRPLFVETHQPFGCRYTDFDRASQHSAAPRVLLQPAPVSAINSAAKPFPQSALKNSCLELYLARSRAFYVAWVYQWILAALDGRWTARRQQN